ncbi:MAG: hypothetical protein ACK4OO_07390, partial [bacterium]
LVDRDGRIVESWDRHGLRGVYAFAYHPRDEEGMFLYVANLEDDGSAGIYRANPSEGRIEMIRRLAGAPTGLFFTDQWDRGREILGLVRGERDQFLTLYDLGRRPLWVEVNPNQGNLGAGERETLNLFFRIPQNAQIGENFNLQMAFWAVGGYQLYVPIITQIVRGFQHFRPPIVSDEAMTIVITEVWVALEPLFITSEIAALTPAGEVGGLVRWMGEEVRMEAYSHQEGFQPGDTMRFAVWDAVTGEELEMRAEFLEGENRFEVGGEVTVRLWGEYPLLKRSG